VLLSIVIGSILPSLVAAQERPTIVFTPTQYFNADAESAENVTRALIAEFSRQRYTVIPMERSREAFAAAGLEERRDIGDPQLIPFGRSLNADLVAHPQLLAAGLPGAAPAGSAAAYRPGAVIHLRILNARTGKHLFTRQIRYEFDGSLTEAGASTVRTASVPPPVATGAVGEITRLYFERVAGSRQEIGQPPR
jgi:hypothetical protein